MGWTVSFIVIFSVAALVPAIWAIVGLAMGNRKFWPAIAGTVWALLLMLVTFVGIGTRWGGCTSDAESSAAVTCMIGEERADCQPDIWHRVCGEGSPRCGRIAAGAYCPAGARPVFDFCERVNLGGRVMQPWATWSDLSFIAAGLWILWWLHRVLRTGTTRNGSSSVIVTADNPMLTIGFLSVGYGFIVIFMGPPSMWFHASMKQWGGWFDAMSVVMWLGFNALYVLYALAFTMWGNGRGIARPITIFACWAAVMAGFGALAWEVPGSRLWGYIVSGAIWGVAEVAYVIVGASCSGVKYRRYWPLFVANVTTLAVTMGIWLLFNDDVVSAAACQGREKFPGHGLFHILAACATMITFASFASEQRLDSS